MALTTFYNVFICNFIHPTISAYILLGSFFQMALAPIAVWQFQENNRNEKNTYSPCSFSSSLFIFKLLLPLHVIPLLLPVIQNDLNLFQYLLPWTISSLSLAFSLYLLHHWLPFLPPVYAIFSSISVTLFIPFTFICVLPFPSTLGIIRSLLVFVPFSIICFFLYIVMESSKPP